MIFVGFSGTPQVLHKSHPLPVTLAGQTSQHQFVHSVQTPVNLLGRDILVKTGASILCCADSLRVTFPNGHWLDFGTQVYSKLRLLLGLHHSDLYSKLMVNHTARHMIYVRLMMLPQHPYFLFLIHIACSPPFHLNVHGLQQSIWLMPFSVSHYTQTVDICLYSNTKARNYNTQISHRDLKIHQAFLTNVSNLSCRMCVYLMVVFC